MEHCLVYITVADRDAALSLARLLVAERLAACANLIGDIRSVFHWDGAVQEEGEVALLAKTRSALLPRLTERVTAVHAYDCPCVVALPIVGGNPAFLDWIDAQTAAPAD